MFPGAGVVANAIHSSRSLNKKDLPFIVSDYFEV
jgi:hypothetical protein